MEKFPEQNPLLYYILMRLIKFYYVWFQFMFYRDGSEIVKTYMTKGVLTIDKSKLILDAAKIMSKLDVGCLLVTDGDSPVGIITKNDIISKVVAKELRSDSVHVNEVMSFPFISINVNQSVSDALRVMGEKSVDYLVVMDEDEVVGLFSLVNIVNLESYRLNFG